MENQSNGAAIAALVLGVLSIILIFPMITAPLGLILGIVGIVMSNKAKAIDPQSGMGKAGFVTSIIGLIICAIITVIVVVGLALFGAAIGFGLGAISNITGAFM